MQMSLFLSREKLVMNSLLNRRQFLGSTCKGLGGIALTSLLAREGLMAKTDPASPAIDSAKPFAARQPHFAPTAKNVLVIFCSGACSQLDTFDYKPELIKRNGLPMPGAEGLKTFQGAQGNLTRSPWEFKPRGQSGKMVSELVPSPAVNSCATHRESKPLDTPSLSQELQMKGTNYQNNHLNKVD